MPFASLRYDLRGNDGFTSLHGFADRAHAVQRVPTFLPPLFHKWIFHHIISLKQALVQADTSFEAKHATEVDARVGVKAASNTEGGTD